MASRHKEPTPTEVDSASDVEVNINFTYKPSPNITQAMESIDKWKSKRMDIQKGIDKDSTNKLSGIKNKIKKHYHDETQKRTAYSQQRLQRLIAALEKRTAIEEKISTRIDALREDCAHMAMLINAVYVGRKEAATQSARLANPSQPTN
ncbi:uncharacterized protein F4812DRAFT_466171 [Daldinia caldariorum]|uniref:uncharacterized protein n=1 Tax=Daldinia caldariorum TaxID=326644 RepID=UPI002007E131|nr:uncharacterized protein F4812DRAFT_466171 [Daldinia caldariorum]KAI1465728.1 hypothetical protein F4812DRAFT_466171 [Daldinia caldariorum]